MADLVITAANVAKGTGAQTDRGTAGATLTAGQPLYKDVTDADKLKLGQGTTSAAAELAGVSLHAALSGQPVEYIVAGDYNPGATVTVGLPYMVSAAAAGGVAPYSDLASGNFPSLIGFATATNKISVTRVITRVAKP